VDPAPDPLLLRKSGSAGTTEEVFRDENFDQKIIFIDGF
jgi:hypothetical protein